MESKAMDLETIGGGAASGFVTAVLSILGVNWRISKLEKEMQKLDKEKADKLMVEELRRVVESNRLVSEGLLRDSVDTVRQMVEGNKRDTIQMVSRIEQDIQYIRQRLDVIADRMGEAIKA